MGSHTPRDLFINPFSYGVLGLGSSVTKSEVFSPFGETRAAVDGATPPKKLVKVERPRNAALHKRAAVRMVVGPGGGTNVDIFVAGAARW